MMMRASAIAALAVSLLLCACGGSSEELPATATAVIASATPTIETAEPGIISAPPDQTITYAIDVETGSVAVAPSPSPGPPSSSPYNGPHGEPAAIPSTQFYANAVVSPDGWQVIYLRNDATTLKGLDTELVLANADGTDPHDLTSTPENEYDPLYWTSDGLSVVLWRDTIPASDPGWTASNAHLIRKDIASGAETVIAPDILIGAQRLAWMPAGDQFAAIDGDTRKVVLVDAFSGEVRTLAVLAEDQQLQVGNLRWDAAGQHLLVDARSPTICESCDPLL